MLLVTGQVALATRAQRVAVLEGGRLHELESPGELLRPGSRYWRLLQGGGQRGTVGNEGEGQQELGTPRDGDSENMDGDTETWDVATRIRDGDTGSCKRDTRNRGGDSKSRGGDSKSCDKGL